MTFGSYGVLPAELLEREYPIVVEEFGFVPDTEGAGRHRGSVAVAKQWRFLGPGKVMVRTNRLRQASTGLSGGGAGALASNMLRTTTGPTTMPKDAHIHLDIEQGDVLRHVTAGSGGHGDPWTRQPDRVGRDVADGKISPERARRAYGVVVDGIGGVDGEATSSLRGHRP
jgi:N-methylhydantoinase B